MADPARYRPQPEPPDLRVLALAGSISLAVVSGSTCLLTIFYAAFRSFGFWGGLGVSSFVTTILGVAGALAVNDYWKKEKS